MKTYRVVACAFLMGGLSGAALLFPFFHKNITARVIAQDVHDWVRLVEYRFDEHAASIDCWGDSLTEGKMLTPGHDFPSLISYVFRRKVVNRGVGGETSRQIEQRMLSRHIPPFPESVIIWAGRNDDLSDVNAIADNIDAMIRSLHPRSRFLVLGILNSDTARERRGGDRYRSILDLNEHLRQRYGRDFVAIRDFLVTQGNKDDDDDEAAMAADVIPPSLRLDALHLNDQGEALVAYAVEAAIKANGW